jgi:hypothetical protein
MRRAAQADARSERSCLLFSLERPAKWPIVLTARPVPCMSSKPVPYYRRQENICGLVRIAHHDEPRPIEGMGVLSAAQELQLRVLQGTGGGEC